MQTAHWYVITIVLLMMVITNVHVRLVIMVVAIFLPQNFFYKRGRKNSSWITDHSCCESWVCVLMLTSN